MVPMISSVAWFDEGMRRRCCWRTMRGLLLLMGLRLMAIGLMGCQPAQTPCADVGDCLGDQYCQQGRCRDLCTSTRDCLGDERCNAQGQCVSSSSGPDSGPGQEPVARPDTSSGSDAQSTPDRAFVPDASHAEQPPDVPAPPSCRGVVLSQPSQLNVDLKALVVSGRITVNGQAMGGASLPRGRLAFRHHRGGVAHSTDFGAANDARYTVKLFPGTYDVDYIPDPTCAAKGSPLPCMSYTVLRDQQISQPSSLDLDLKVVELAGRVTKAGQGLPSSSRPRGALSFQRVEGGAISTDSFGVSGDVRYRIKLFVGTYLISYKPSSRCQPDDAALPCQHYVVYKGLNVSQSSNYNVDLKEVSITGRLTRGGAQLANVSSGGAIRFVASEGGSISLPLASSGPLRYQGKVFPGSYQVMYQPPSSCDGGGALPCMVHQLKESIVLRQSSQLDFDVKVVPITGQLTLHQQQAPGSSTKRGWLRFTSAWGDLRTELFAPTGAIRYRAELFAGTYKVEYLHYRDCPKESQVPCQSTRLHEALPIVQPSHRDFDLKAISFASHVTLHGKPIPDWPDKSRGSLELRPASEQPQGNIALSFGDRGAVRLQRTVFAGVYDLYFKPGSRCREGAPLPCQETLIKRGLSLRQSSAFDVDLKVIQVVGRVTLAKQAVPGASRDRGRLRFRLRGGSDATTERFGASGDIRYQIRLFPGEYDVQFEGGVGCSSTDPLPCQMLLLKGCLSQP